MRDRNSYGHGYWRSLAHRDLSTDQAADAWKEFQASITDAPPQPSLQEPIKAERLTKKEHTALSRRNFMGASAALAGAAATTGCIRKPVEKIIPHGQRPEDTIPGEPLFYASAVAVGATVQGVLVESQDGRPTKIEGNVEHSGSNGATDVFAQASVLDVYDPDRTRAPLEGAGDAAVAIAWSAAREKVTALLLEKDKTKGKGLALVVDQTLSPTMRSQIALFKTRYAEARVFTSDATAPSNAIAAAELIGGPGARTTFSLANANVVFALDSDFLTAETDHVRLSREWARKRSPSRPTDFMSRLYVAETSLSSAGIASDHRVRTTSAGVGDLLVALAKALKVKWPPGVVEKLPAPQLSEQHTAFINAIAADLVAKENLGKSAILVGERQPAWVQALGLFINTGLRNAGAVQWRFDSDALEAESAVELSKALDAGTDTVLCLGVNPAYDTAADLNLGEKLKAANTLHFGLYRDETGTDAKMHIPVSHWLEAWGDLLASDALNKSIQQPLIAPLHDTYSVLEWMGLFASGKMYEGSELLKDHYTQESLGKFSDRIWRSWLHKGLVHGIAQEPVLPQKTGWAKIVEAAAAAPKTSGAFEINLYLSPNVLDGRFANNAWMQELPHPVTKMVWDNAALVSKKTAEKLGVVDGDLLQVEANGASLQIPAFVAPGQAEDTVSITLGYGRTWGSVAKDVGFNGYPLRTAATPWFFGGNVSKGSGSHELVTTQEHGTMKPPTLMGVDYPERPIALEATRAEWQGREAFVEDVNLMKEERLRHLWSAPKLTGRQQWGMSIDLGTCTGCNTCVIACQAENNIPVVGKKQVATGREMHWIRIDRYFRGNEDEPTAVMQPMACQHCEAAPCETVCPVAATVHSPEGLNEMTYNRCIGTRYCSNNCPYKVRRFNFFHYHLDKRPGWNDNDTDGSLLRQMQMNPDVTVRFRGVMEKCTYCVQRINQAKIKAHVDGKDSVDDGAIITACQAACPTGAIVFGDIADKASAVSKAKDNSRDYQVLRDLNNGPRTTYLARVHNPNPALAEQHLLHTVGVEAHAAELKLEEKKKAAAGGHGGGHGAEGKKAH